jgi:membrane protease YdiL (CAAX protease family)
MEHNEPSAASPPSTLHPPPSNFRWSAAQAIVVTITIYIVAQIAAGLLISLYPALRDWTAAQANHWLDTSVVGQFGFIVLVEAFTLGFLRWFLRRHNSDWRSLGLRRPKLRDIGYALVGFVTYLLLYGVTLIIAQALVPSLNVDQKQQLGFDTVSGGGQLVLVFASLVILPRLVEEILMRGFLYGSLRAKWPKIQAALVASGLFAAAHLQFGNGAPLLWVAAIDTFILSLVLIELKEKTEGLAAPIMLHMLKNGITFIALFILVTT